MTTTNNLPKQIHSGSLTKRALQGSGIALVLIGIFLIGVKNPNPAWGKFWMVKPLLMVPVFGGLGGIFYYFMDHLRCMGGWKTVLAYFISFIGFVVAVWLGTVLGLNGTLWN
jgi:ABC-type transport system involved in cytochrome c biogenesis permease subunit